MSESNEFATIPEIVEAARARLEPHMWDACCGGAESETLLRRNRTALDSLAFRPRVLRNVVHRDTSTTFLGHRLALPVMLALVGFVRQLHPQSGLACARAAQRAGTCAFLTSGATSSPPGLEGIRKEIDGPVFSQLYVRGDRKWLKATVSAPPA